MLGRIILAGAVASAVATTAYAAEKQFGLGDVIYRKELREPLPNAFGGKDVFGRKRAAGFIEVRYLGLDGGRAIFARRDTRIVSSDTTVSRYAATQAAMGNGVAVVGNQNLALAPSEILVPVDLSADRTLLVDGVSLRIVEATSSRLTVDVPDAKK